MSKMTDAEIVRKAMDHWKYLVEVEPDTRRRNGFLKRVADLERIAKRLEEIDARRWMDCGPINAPTDASATKPISVADLSREADKMRDSPPVRPKSRWA